MKQETYKAARARLLLQLKDMGWTTKPSLVVPQAIDPTKSMHLFFHPQAVYLFKHSMWIDIRGMTVETLIEKALLQRAGL